MGIVYARTKNKLANEKTNKKYELNHIVSWWNLGVVASRSLEISTGLLSPYLVRFISSSSVWKSQKYIGQNITQECCSVAASIYSIGVVCFFSVRFFRDFVLCSRRFVGRLQKKILAARPLPESLTSVHSTVSSDRSYLSYSYAKSCD